VGLDGGGGALLARVAGTSFWNNELGGETDNLPGSAKLSAAKRRKNVGSVRG
jgi:hypothetical protein